MIINHNVPALVTNNALRKANSSTDRASKKLSTGTRINNAADDAAGLAISNKMKTQVKGLEMADRNCNDAISLIQTAEGGMSEIQNMLQRVRELAIQGGNDTLTTDDRLKIQTEVDQLIVEITDTSNKVEYNTKKLLDGSEPVMTFQIGPNQDLIVNVNMENLKGDQLGKLDANGDLIANNSLFELCTAQADLPAGSTALDLADGTKIASGQTMFKDASKCRTAVLEICDGAISQVSEFRARLGAVQNRLEYTSASLGVASENTETALSRIQDTDMAAEMTEYTSDNVIVQAGISMLTQANQRPNQLLQLLQ